MKPQVIQDFERETLTTCVQCEWNPATWLVMSFTGILLFKISLPGIWR